MSDEISQLKSLYLEPRYLSFRCQRCGELAAEFAFLPAGARSGDALWEDNYRLERRGFLGVQTIVRPVQDLVSIFRALRQADWQAVWKIDADIGGFHCPDCQAIYCDRCWQLEPPRYDEDLPGFFDYLAGSCPQGHRHILDD